MNFQKEIKNKKSYLSFRGIGNNRGFVILFAVTLSSIVLAIALGVADIAFRELRFSTSTKDTNEAFFAADTATELTLLNDKPPADVCPLGGNPSSTCDYEIGQLGSTGNGCAKVKITKITTLTTIISKGYNLGSGGASVCSPPSNSVEREIKTTYGGGGGILFGNDVSFLTMDTTTEGSWHGSYGTDGYNIFGATQSYPAYASVTPSGHSFYTWQNPTLDPDDKRGLYKDSVTTERIAYTWYADTNFTLDVNITDGNNHQIAIYMLDWDNYGPRSARIEVLDGDTSSVLDTQNLNVPNYVPGAYLVWNASGHVTFRFTDTEPAGSNVTTSGIFFD